jgi:predicted adenine nucleotide alpha hydrolase (AANH) superfamily ATPase
VNLLLHSCCGPCTVFPYKVLKPDHDISVYFFNPNIHPYKEFIRRRNTLLSFCKDNYVDVIGKQEYGLREYLRRVVGDEDNKCTYCYAWRMEETALMACSEGFDGFTTTLLYSKYQDHERLKEFGFSLAEKYSISFVYNDFRVGWQEGIDASIQLDMYRQPYCGCIYSEQERYDKKFRKKK